MNAPVRDTNWNSTGYPTADWLAVDPARRLAQKIETYWAVRGQRVRTTVDREFGGYVIRSDMVDGFPRA